MNVCSMRLVTTCFVLVLVVTVPAACGWKTPPLVPDNPRPEAVKDIKTVTRDAVTFLSWPIPNRNVEGKSMSVADIQSFRIYRAEIRPGRKKSRYRLFAEIDMANPAPSMATVKNGVVFWTDRNLTYGKVYGYRLQAVSTRGGTSKQSDEVRVAPLLSLAIPKGLTAQGGDSYNLLSWEPVGTRMDGSRYSGFVGYNVYRGTEKGKQETTPLNKEPLRTNSYKDTAVVNDSTYYYLIRSVDSPTPPWRESLDSDEASATPRDLTPPGEPTGLSVVAGVDRVLLTWNENKESDLAGYVVYRSTTSGKNYERQTDKLLGRATFSDETVKAGTTYYYIITAIDKAGNESARSGEQKVFVEELRKKFRNKNAP